MSVQPMWVRVADRIRNRIRNGDLALGEKLPPLSQLCAEYGTDANAVRQAFVVLETEGLIRRTPGVGVVIAGRPPGLRPHVFRWHSNRRPRGSRP
ncbi:MAG TPA: winged helix-turn-helix domain-containing protein [Micromonosporaceae bacterium]|nr:winged helix-turn-helix domain-containing protein [Micromonosporaceae bacterium]